MYSDKEYIHLNPREEWALNQQEPQIPVAEGVNLLDKAFERLRYAQDIDPSTGYNLEMRKRMLFRKLVMEDCIMAFIDTNFDDIAGHWSDEIQADMDDHYAENYE